MPYYREHNLDNHPHLCKANSTVGFAGLLGVLVDLLNNLRLSVDSMPDADALLQYVGLLPIV